VQRVQLGLADADLAVERGDFGTRMVAHGGGGGVAVE
jgi:hypothetical protein